MCKQTHAQFAIGFSYLVVILLDKFFNQELGMNFYLLALIMPTLAMKGAKFPDYDQNWNSISEKTDFSRLVSRLIHMTGGTHRSKHTHSWDICLLTLAGFLVGATILMEEGIFTEFDRLLASVLILGYYSGWVSHLLSDMFNGDGVWLTIFAKKKIAFVPKKLFGIHFKTGGAWENFFFKVCLFINRIMTLVMLVYPLITSGWLEDKILQII